MAKSKQSRTRAKRMRELPRIAAEDWDHAFEMMESISQEEGGMRDLVETLGGSEDTTVTELLVGRLCEWHKSVWTPKATASLLVKLTKLIPEETLKQLPEVVITMLTITELTGLESFSPQGRSKILEFVIQHGIKNSSRLKTVIVPHASEILLRAKAESKGNL